MSESWQMYMLMLSVSPKRYKTFAFEIFLRSFSSQFLFWKEQLRFWFYSYRLVLPIPELCVLLNIMFRFIYLIACICNLFLFIAKYYSIVWICHNLSMLLLIDKLAPFQCFSIMNKVTVTITVHGFWGLMVSLAGEGCVYANT